MKAVILAGGLGSRLAEETSIRPKPMVEIGGKPILWHIMKVLGSQGITDFIVCCGYKGYMVKEYFANYFLHTSDFTVDLKNNRVEIERSEVEPWRVTLIDTGETTMTGGRLRRIRHLVDDDAFLMTYGDGLADVDVTALVEAHRRGGRAATVTGVQPAGRFGSLLTEGDRVTRFTEKVAGDGSWVSGGFFVVEPECLDLVADDQTMWENEPLEHLARRDQLGLYRHYGFWQPMDTLRDKHRLEELWSRGEAPWQIW